mmetsp:Transcript_4067/g.9499  ORF Transcript_4067/g.9499 Transcript_4067/m.9499 type:complete len:93 (+) Transcript_4067:134-412(+)
MRPLLMGAFGTWPLLRHLATGVFASFANVVLILQDQPVCAEQLMPSTRTPGLCRQACLRIEMDIPQSYLFRVAARCCECCTLRTPSLQPQLW